MYEKRANENILYTNTFLKLSKILLKYKRLTILV